MERLASRVNIGTVATHAGVGIGTVSRVLNGSPQVREETRRRVLEVIDRLQYRPNRLAAALSRGTTSSVVVMVTCLTRPSVVERLAGVVSVLEEYGYDTVVLNVETPEQRDRHLRALATQPRAAGVIVVSLPLARGHTELLQAAGVPLVMVDATAPGYIRYLVDNVAGGRLATEHLLRLGHRRIAFVGEATDRSFSQPSTELRLRGYRAALRQWGVAPEPRLVALNPHVPGVGAGPAARLVTGSRPPTAIFAASDVQAMSLVHAFGQQGMRVPEDISLVGFDDIEVAALARLTTVRQPLHESGARAARRLCQLLAGDAGRGRQVLLPLELVERTTTAPPAGTRRRRSPAAPGRSRSRPAAGRTRSSPRRPGTVPTPTSPATEAALPEPA